MSGEDPELEERMTELLDHARKRESDGDWTEAIGLLEQGIDTARDNPRLRATLQLPLAGLLWKQGEMARAEALLSEARATAESSGDEGLLSEAYYQLGEVHYVKRFYMKDAEYGEALPYHEKALELRLRLGDREGASDSYSRVGTIHERLGDWEEAHRHYREAIRIAEEAGFTQGLTRPLTHIGGFHRRQGETDKAFEYYREALKTSEASGNHEDVMFSLANGAQMTHRVDGDPERALDHCRRALEIAERKGFILAIARIHYGIATIHLGEGNADSAREHFQKVIEVSEGSGYRYFIGPAEEQLQKLA